MSGDALLKGITAAATAEGQTREERAQHVAQIVRDRRSYKWVGVFDVDENEEGVLLGEAGNGPSGDHLSMPILGPETGALMGTLDVEGREDLTHDDEIFLEDCSAALLAIYE